MSDIYKKWQIEWRKIMGFDPNTDSEYDSDFDIHFGLWDLDKDKLHECFSILPFGEEMYSRVISRLEKDKSKAFKDEYLQELAETALLRLTSYINSPELKNAKIRIVRGNEEDRLRFLMNADSIAQELQDDLCNLIKQKSGEQAYAAYFFLTEPLYRMSSYYEPVNWVLWSLTGIQNNDPFEPIYRLWELNCQIVVDDEGILIFHNSN